MHRLLGDVRGKTILDVGCGEGQDALLLAKLGADVRGIDLSAGAIRVARQRCALNRTTAEFICSPVEELTAGQYDVVWVEALLHHALHDLDHVIKSIAARVKPGGMIIMCEPVSLSSTLRKLRLKLGTPNGTPDERPLEHSALAIIRRYVPGMELRYFRSPLARLDKFLYDQYFERAPLPIRLVVRSVSAIDRCLLILPGLQRIAGVAVMFARL
jgi:SAM-dependent methyltransferase